MPTIEEQLTEVYSVIDELQVLERRLRTSIDAAITTLKGAQDDPTDAH